MTRASGSAAGSQAPAAHAPPHPASHHHTASLPYSHPNLVNDFVCSLQRHPVPLFNHICNPPPRPPHSRQLDLRSNAGLDSASAARLAPLLHPHYRCGLRRLDLSGCPALGDAGFAALAMNLAQNKMLQVGFGGGVVDTSPN